MSGTSCPDIVPIQVSAAVQIVIFFSLCSILFPHFPNYFVNRYVLITVLLWWCWCWWLCVCGENERKKQYSHTHKTCWCNNSIPFFSFHFLSHIQILIFGLIQALQIPFFQFINFVTRPLVPLLPLPPTHEREQPPHRLPISQPVKQKLVQYYPGYTQKREEQRRRALSSSACLLFGERKKTCTRIHLFIHSNVIYYIYCPFFHVPLLFFLLHAIFFFPSTSGKL